MGGGKTGRRQLVAAAVTTLAAVALVGPSASAAPSGPQPLDVGPSVVSAAGAYYPTAAVRLLGTATSAYAAVPGSDTRVAVAGLPGIPASGLSAAVVNLTVSAGPAAVAVSAFPGTGPVLTDDPGAPFGPTGPDGPSSDPTSSAATASTTGATGPSEGLAEPRVSTPSAASAPPVASARPVNSGRPVNSVAAPPGATRTTLVTVPLDPTGAFDVRTTGGGARLVADLVGVYAADDTVVARLGIPGGYQPLDPVRLLGPREAVSAPLEVNGLTPSEAPALPRLAAAVPAGATTSLAVDLGSSTAHVSALAVRVSVVSPAVPGTVDVTGGPQSTPLDQDAAAPTATAAAPTPVTAPPAPLVRSYATPTLSLTPGAAASNLAIVPTVLGSDGLITLEVRNASTRPLDVLVDLVGFYDDGQLGPNLRFRSLPPTRVIDSSAELGVPALAVEAEATLVPPASVAGDNTFGLVGMATVRTTTLGADLVLWPDADPQPAAGSVPVSAGAQVAVPIQCEIGADGALELASTSGPAELTLDVVGSFEAYPAVTDPTTRGWVDAVPAWQVSVSRR